MEVTAGGKFVRDLDMREDVPGQPLRLTINAPLQDYAARRLGLESGAVVVMDCLTGDLLAMASMPSYDPNSFADGIGRIRRCDAQCDAAAYRWHAQHRAAAVHRRS